MPKVPFSIEDAVRNDHAIRPRREIVVQCVEGSAATNAALAIELPEVFLGLGID